MTCYRTIYPMLPVPLDILPQGFPGNTSIPKFQIGDRVRWQPQPAEDFGIVIGIQYAPAQHLQTWTWRYVIWLDHHSPSRLWVMTDTAWETDLELLVAITHPQVTSENEQS